MEGKQTKNKEMAKTNFNDLLEAGAHFGHLRRKWNPNMAPYIFMEKNGIHIIDLHKTVVKIDEAAAAMKQIAKSGKKNSFCSYKKTSQRDRGNRSKKGKHALRYRTLAWWYANKLCYNPQSCP